MDFFQTICDSLPDYSEGKVWSNGSEILVKSESAAEILADINVIGAKVDVFV